MRQLVLFLLVILLSASSARAEHIINYGNGIVSNPELERRVEFWRLIFTKYGEHQVVFHHRDFPDIIYSVLDFSTEAQRYKVSAYSRLRSDAVDHETVRIRAILRKLAAGASAQTAFERRVWSLFAHALDSTSERVIRRAIDAASEEKQIRTQTGIKERFREGVRRSGRYLYGIESVFRLHDLPPELARLPLVESSFDYTAYSSVGAAGIWQFMRSTGKRYMMITASVDERRDPIASSRAAADYLANAFENTQSWPLAITSYNHGLTGVMRAAKSVGSREITTIIKEYDGERFGFASENFYAEFLAALDVERHAKSYFPGIRIDEPVYFEEVLLDRPTSYSRIVKLSGLSEAEFRELNTALMKPVTSGRVSVPTGYTVKVPRGQGRTFIARLGYGEQLQLLRGVSKGASVVVREDRPQQPEPVRVAALEPRVLEKNTAAREVVRRAAEPSPEITRDLSSSGQEGDLPPVTHTVKKGETLGGIAKRYGVTAEELKRLNNLKDARSLRAGRVISVGVAAETEAPKSLREPNRKLNSEKISERSHTVQKGETLSSIARKYGTPLAAIKAANPLAVKRIKPGQKLVVP